VHIRLPASGQLAVLSTRNRWYETMTAWSSQPRKERVMRVLVTAATEYGATGEIAQAIGAVLSERGLDTTVASPEQVQAIVRGPLPRRVGGQAGVAVLQRPDR
jgi:flavorubredoxin